MRKLRLKWAGIVSGLDQWSLATELKAAHQRGRARFIPIDKGTLIEHRVDAITMRVYVFKSSHCIKFNVLRDWTW